jgi:hypothetical protein
MCLVRSHIPQDHLYKDGSVVVVGSLPHALNADSVRQALTSLLQRIGVAPGGFTDKSMRR